MRIEYLRNLIRNNRYIFDKIALNISTADNDLKKIYLCSQAANFASRNPCGIFNSKTIEDSLVSIAEKNLIKIPEHFSTNSFLHVMTRAYSTGGHTRVCERWIKNAPSNQKHSTILISQRGSIPQHLKDAVQEKAGEILSLQVSNPLEMALELRKIASNYQYVVLHIHMYDVIPILAFGTRSFKRLVLFFNHADHLFWLGCSIADIVINFRSDSSQFNMQRRHLYSNYTLALPIDKTRHKDKNKKNIIEIKKGLGFKENSKVIISMGSPYKYNAFRGLDFIKTIEEIVKRNKNVVFLIIGPSKNDQGWHEAFKRTKGRINPVGIIPNDEVDNYLMIADLGIDSFPLPSITAFLEVAKYNIPCLALKTPVSIRGTFEKTGVYCETTSELIERTLFLINTASTNQKLKRWLKRECLPNAYQKKLILLNDFLIGEHKVKPTIQDTKKNVSEMELYVLEVLLRSNHWFINKIKNYCSHMLYLYIFYVPTCMIGNRLYRFLNKYGLM